MITLDIDGTLLGYDSYGDDAPTINRALLRSLAIVTSKVALVTNQGGLPWGVMGSVRKDGQHYPRPEHFYHRYLHLMDVLHAYDIEDVALRVCVFHPKAPTHAIQKAAAQLRTLFGAQLFDWKIYTTERARKPNPFMLRSVGAGCYYGDSDEDEQAAIAAGIEFIRVERFR